MDSLETESNCSSDGFHSNASTVSGLSLYGNEFAELRHLVNPSKYPQPYLERSSTPKAELFDDTENIRLQELKNNLQQALDQNEKYKLDLENLERKTELKYCSKIDNLLRSNSKLEGELENANNQIERLIKNYKQKHDHLIYKEKLDLERKIYQLNSSNSKLETQCSKIQLSKNKLDLQNSDLKTKLGELVTEIDIKNSAIQSLKEKISEQHIQIENSHKNYANLNQKLNCLNTKLIEAEKSKLWYREQLTVSQNDKIQLQSELIKHKNQIVDCSERIFTLKIDLSKYKNEVDEVRLQALKEKEELFKKLENINLDCTDCSILRPVLEKVSNDNYNYEMQYYEQTIEDLKEEVHRIKIAIQNKDEELEKLVRENSKAISNCLVLQKTIKQNESNIESLENCQKNLVRKVEYLKESEKEKLCENLQLKNKVAELEIELRMRNKEKRDVDRSVQLVREQFIKIKENYEKVKTELNLKNKDILQLQKDKQELFMNNNWTICELEKIKHKDIVINDLKAENEHLVSNIETLTKQIKLLEMQNLKSDKINKEKEIELNNLNNIIMQYKTMITEQEDEAKNLSQQLIESDEDLTKTIEKKQNEYKTNLELIISEKNNILMSYNSLQEKYSCEIQNKDKSISNLQCKLVKIEDDWRNYLKRITDDQKVEILLNNHKTFHLNVDNYIKKTFDKLNIEDFESSVDIRLKYLDERVRKVGEKSEQLREKITSQSEQDKIKELEILLQVKDRDMEDKKKKMDRNNRTLLRKVKEHMKGRNSAEKQLKYLQDLYDNMADNHNTSILTLSSKDHEIQSLKELCDGYKKEIEKLRSTVMNLEQTLAKSKVCGNCIEFEDVKHKVVYFDALCKDLQQINLDLEEEVKSSKENIASLCEKDKFQQKEIVDVQQKYEVTLNKLHDIEKYNVSQKETIVKLEKDISEKEVLYENSKEIVDKLQQDLTEAREKVEFLSSEIHISSSQIQQKVEYIQELEGKIKELEEHVLKINLEQQSVITDYKETVLQLQDEMKVLRSDKFFLQRLSNDLKIALTSYVDHNEKLQNQLKILTTDKQPFKSLPNNLLEVLDNISLPGKYDDKYISQLLEENRTSSVPVTAEIQDCLSKLREEIFSLQEQISKKNSVGILDIG